MAFGYRSGFLAVFLICLPVSLIAQHHPIPQLYTSVRNVFALAADSGTSLEFAETCLYPRYPVRTRESTSIETLIEFIQRLEDVLANTTDTVLQNFRTPDMVARLLLQRFNIPSFQSFDVAIDESITIDTRILGTIPGVNEWYYFPDSVFTEAERCTLFQMFSHAYMNTGVRSS